MAQMGQLRDIVASFAPTVAVETAAEQIEDDDVEDEPHDDDAVEETETPGPEATVVIDAPDEDDDETRAKDAS